MFNDKYNITVSMNAINVYQKVLRRVNPPTKVISRPAHTPMVSSARNTQSTKYKQMVNQYSFLSNAETPSFLFLGFCRLCYLNHGKDISKL